MVDHATMYPENKKTPLFWVTGMSSIVWTLPKCLDKVTGLFVARPSASGTR